MHFVLYFGKIGKITWEIQIEYRIIQEAYKACGKTDGKRTSFGR